MKLDNLLRTIGKTTNEINAFFDRWQEHTENTRLDIIRSLKAIGHLSPKLKNESQTDTFKCPMHGFTLIRPCGLTSCQYHLPSILNNQQQQQATISCKNCLIYCLDNSKNNRMSAQDVSNVMGISVSEINTSNSNAVSKIRRAKIKEQLEKHQIPRFRYLSGHCVCCEQYIQDELEVNLWPELIIQPNVHGWCSVDCKDKKPKWQFLIEKEFECNYLHALSVGFLLYNNIENLGGIFFLNKDILQKNKSQIQKNLEFLKRHFFQ